MYFNRWNIIDHHESQGSATEEEEQTALYWTMEELSEGVMINVQDASD